MDVKEFGWTTVEIVRNRGRLILNQVNRSHGIPGLPGCTDSPVRTLVIESDGMLRPNPKHRKSNGLPAVYQRILET